MKASLIITMACLAFASASYAETFQSAKVTTRINDVRLYQPNKAARLAKVGDTVRGHTSVQTGRRSRAELTFQDKTVTRLGSNSTFSFRKGSRDINLNAGSILLQVPKNAGGATIRTATVTAAITGTTLMMEYNTGKWIKLITLEGTVALKLEGKGAKPSIFGRPQKVKVPAGKMIIMRPDGAIISKPVDVDLKRLLQTSLLAGNTIFSPLSPEAQREIAKAVARQDRLKRKGILVSENIVNRQPGSRVIEHRHTLRDIRDVNHSPNGGENPGDVTDPTTGSGGVTAPQIPGTSTGGITTAGPIDTANP